MGRDVRTFQVYLTDDDDALIWQVLRTIEAAAQDDASGRGLEVAGTVGIEHASGKYTRDTVAEARERAEDNDFQPDRVSVQLALTGPDAPLGSTWIQATRYRAPDPLTVEVDEGSASEVDRVIVVLQAAVMGTPGASFVPEPAEQVSRRDRDTRTFKLSVLDDATLWQALAAIETAATDDASDRGLEVSTEVSVEHATGKYARDTVAEAREISQRNDFAPGQVRFDMSLAQTVGRHWVHVFRFSAGDPMTVEVTEGSPAEADRLLAVLRDAATAIPGAKADADRVERASWRDRDTRKFQVPLPDDDTKVWQVLQTIEAAAKAETSARGQSLATELRVGDASGEYTRNTAAEARDTLARNDMVPRRIDFRLTFKPLGDTSPWRTSEEGIAVRRYEGDRPLSVEIAMDDEVELNRMFATLQETIDSELRTEEAAPGLGASDQDTRKFRVETADDLLLWRVLEAVASAAEDAARHADRTVAATLSIGHSTGEYVRSTVTEAKATSQKNGFSPESVDFRLFRIGPDADLTLRHQSAWIRVARQETEEPLVIEILSGNEIEVSGVFNKLQDHVKAAIASTQAGTNNAVLTPPASLVPTGPRWKRILNHGWTVEVVGGLTAAVGGGLIIAWIVSR